jgi:hypothetical protein
MDLAPSEERDMARKQRKSKFAIDYRNAGTDEVTLAVINDLLRKYPRGVTGRLGNKRDYEDNYRCNPHQGATGQYCGYTWEQLWTLLKAYIKDGGCGYGTSRDLVKKHWEKYDKEKATYEWMPSATCTRRENRLGQRLQHIARHWREQGRKAIYEWKPAYGSGLLNDTPFYVWGNDMIDARAQVSIVWVPILNATGLAGKDRNGNQRDIDGAEGLIKMHTETADAAMTATSAFDTMQSLMTKRQEILDKMAEAQATVENLSGLIEFVSQAAAG